MRSAPPWFLVIVILSAVMVVTSAWGLANPFLFCSQCTATVDGIASDIVVGVSGAIGLATGIAAIRADEDDGLLVGSAIGFGGVAVVMGVLSALADLVFA